MNSLRSLEDWSEENIVFLTISYDAGWQKRGTGRSYNSTTGRGTAFGFYIGKVIGYATRNKRCVACEKKEAKKNCQGNDAHNNNVVVNDEKPHNCRLNFDGSAKAMKADMACTIFLHNPYFNEVKIKLGTLIGDDDASTIASLRKGADYEINKWSDKNHAVSKLSKCLYALRLSTPLVKYFTYCFSCVVERNKNDTNSTKAGLLNIVQHAFDNHAHCGDWCRYHQDQEHNKHKILPGGKGLKDSTLKKKFELIFESFANAADRLSPCSSSQSNESLNKTIASVAPKHLHYGGSASNDIRVGFGILQKNVGNTCTEFVNEKMLNSPNSRLSQKHRLQKDKKALRRKTIAQTIQFKRRRRQLLKLKLNKNNKASQKEGICYKSGCGLAVGIDSVDQPDKIIENVDYSSAKWMIFDLETTGFGKGMEILQIAAKCKAMIFETYVMPIRGIALQASEVTKLTIKNEMLFYISSPVIALSQKDAAKSLQQYLNCIGGNVILIAHNGFRFDRPAIIKFMENEGLLHEFLSGVVGLADSLSIFEEKLKNERLAKSSYKQEVLAEEYLSEKCTSNAHNATYDIEVLQNLMTHPKINMTRQDILNHVKTVYSFIQKRVKVKILKLKQSTQSLSCIKCAKDEGTGGVSTNVIKKMVIAGITMSDLIESHKVDGIRILLSQDVNGKPRVTESKKIIHELCKKLDIISSPVRIFVRSQNLDTAETLQIHSEEPKKV